MTTDHRFSPPGSPREFHLGAVPLDADTTHFKIWAPHATHVALELSDTTARAQPRAVPLTPLPFGYWHGMVPQAPAGTRYHYILNKTTTRPDPVSYSQPDGVHGASEVVDFSGFQWTDHEWRGLPLEQFLVYELHVGTCTPAGTFEGLIALLPYLRREVGITAIELMPVAQFPGARNWGYDGTYLFAPQNTYGGPDGLQRLVDACHREGLAVILDVVYNHLGPEGNYWNEFGWFFTDHYRTPWGSAINYDGPHCDAVRQTVVDNAVHWIRHYHIDALRLDAIHSIFDFGTTHILQEVADAVHTEAQRHQRSAWVIAESDLNDARIITPAARGGLGLDGQWNDDFHHALHACVTGEHQGYYCDFSSVTDIATALSERFVLAGRYSHHRHRHHGNAAAHLPASSFVVFAQNHDQIGNRAMGDRLTTLVPLDAQYALTATILLSPYIPMLFMGEDYGEQAPFQYFVDHGDPGLIEAVRNGRLAEFAQFGWTQVPDPCDVKTFDDSRLTPRAQWSPAQERIHRWVAHLIQLRQRHPSLGIGVEGHKLHVWPDEPSRVLSLARQHPSDHQMLLIVSFNAEPTALTIHHPAGRWLPMLDRETFARSNDTSAPSESAVHEFGTLTEHATESSVDLPPFAVRLYRQLDMP